MREELCGFWAWSLETPQRREGCGLCSVAGSDECTRSQPDDIVRDPRRTAQGNSRPPLLVLEPLRGVPRRARPRRGRDPTRAPIGEGHSNVTYLIERGGQRGRAAPPAAPAAAAERARRAARGAAAGRAAGHAGARAGVLAVCDGRGDDRRPFYVMERIEGDVIVSSVPEALDSRRNAGGSREELIDALVEIHAVDWRAAGPGGLRQADRLPGAPAAALRRPVGAEQDA